MPYARDPHRFIFPMAYTLLEAYISSQFITRAARPIELLCTLRGSLHFDPTRLQVRQWVEEYAKARGVKNFIAGQVNSASRTVISANYFKQMQSSQIIVTSNPSDWEGDFRLMEAMGSGALVFVDRMFVPRPKELISHEHIVIYDNANKTEFFALLDKYRSDRTQARRVALAGYLHAMKYHRAANLIDYVLRVKQSLLHRSSS